MRAFSLRLVSRFVFAAAAFAACDAQAQAPAGYLPPNLPRPPAAAPPAAYPSTATPGASGAAAAQIRLIEPDNSPKVSGTADPKKPEMDRDAGESDLRFQPRIPAGTGPQDPTMPGPDIRNLLDSAGGNRTAPAGPPPLPELRLRARIFAKNKPPVAIVEIGGRPLSVRVGSEIQFSTAGGAMQLKVVELTTDEMQIEVVGRKQIITLN